MSLSGMLVPVSRSTNAARRISPAESTNPLVTSGLEKISGAVGQPEDIAAVIAFIASDEGRFINGTTVVADGGRLDIL